MADRNTSIHRSQLKPILYDDFDATNSPSDNYIPSYDLATGKFTWVEQTGGVGSGNAYTVSFTNGDLSSGVLTVTHNLGSTYPVVEVYDNNEKVITPDEITYVNTNSITVDLSSFGTISGTWNVRVVFGGGGASELDDLSDVEFDTGTPTDKDILVYDESTGVVAFKVSHKISIDGTLAGNSDSDIPTEKAVKTYVDGAVPNLSTSVDDFTIKYVNNQLKIADRIEQNIMLLAFYRAVDQSTSIYNLVDGFIDEYEDETGIDTGASTNEIYNSSGDYYKPTPGEYSSDLIPDMTNHTSPSGEASADHEYSGWEAWKAMDDDPATSWEAGISEPHWLQYQFTSAKTIGRYTITAQDDANIRYITEWTLKASNSGAFGGEEVTLDTQTGQVFTQAEKKTYDFSNSNSYTYYRLDITDMVVTNTAVIAEWELMSVTPPGDITLISNSQTAESSPSQARIVIFEEDVDSITLNIDIKAYVTRENGTGATWEQVTLVDEGNYEGSKRVLSGIVNLDVTGMGVGTDIAYKITTHNLKDLKLHGIGMNWD